MNGYSVLTTAPHKCRLPDAHGFPAGSLIMCDTCWERWRCCEGWPDTSWRSWSAVSSGWAQQEYPWDVAAASGEPTKEQQ